MCQNIFHGKKAEILTGFYHLFCETWLLNTPLRERNRNGDCINIGMFCNKTIYKAKGQNSFQFLRIMKNQYADATS